MIYQGVLQRGIGPAANKIVPTQFMGKSPNEGTPLEFLFSVAASKEGRTFAPILELHDGYTLGENVDVVWTYPDDTQEETLTPSYAYTTGGQIKLEVTPWGALKTISAGYDAEDGGSVSIPLTPNQYLTKIEGLNLAYNLEILCISYSPLTDGTIFGNTSLLTIEAYEAGLSSISLPATIKRACLEGCALSTLDVSGCPDLEDLRAAVNGMTNLNFGNTAFPGLWHICARQNSFTSLRTTNFPALTQLWIWNNSLSGTLSVDSDVIDSIYASDCDYTSLDLSEIDTERVNIKVGLERNALTSIILGSNSFEQLNFTDNADLETIDLTGQTHILKFDGPGCAFNAATIEHILHILDESGITSETPGVFDGVSVDLSGGTNAYLNVNAQVHADSLVTKGWVVSYNTEDLPTDLTETMEDATLADTLTLTDPASLITLPSTVWHHKGLASMRVNLNGIAAAHYMECALISGTFAAGFAYKAASFPSGEYYVRMCTIGNPGAGTGYETRITDQGNTGEGWRRLTAWIYGTTYNLCDIVNGQEVRFAISYTANGVQEVRVYERATDTLLGTASATNPESGTPTYFRLGVLAPVVDVNTVIYFDQLKLDYGVSMHPILV